MTIAPAGVRGRMLKLTFRDLIAACGGVEAAAACCRVGKSMIANYASLVPAHAESFAPIDVVQCLEAIAGEPIVTRLMASEAGGVFVALPDAPADRGELLGLIAAHAREASDMTTAICTALADGHVGQAEATMARRTVRDVLAVVAALDAELKLLEDQ